MTTNATAFTNVVGKDFLSMYTLKQTEPQQAGGGALANGDMTRTNNSLASGLSYGVKVYNALQQSLDVPWKALAPTQRYLRSYKQSKCRRLICRI